MNSHLPVLLFCLCNKFSTDRSSKEALLDTNQLCYSLHGRRQLLPQTEELIPVDGRPLCIQGSDLRIQRQDFRIFVTFTGRLFDLIKGFFQKKKFKCVYQIQNVQIILKYKALHGPLEICEYSQSFGRRERRGQSGSTKLGRAIPRIWKYRGVRKRTAKKKNKRNLQYLRNVHTNSDCERPHY